jgi:hypothetical protein
MVKQAIKNLKDILTYSDSEFLELLIASMHLILLPLAVLVEIGIRPEIQILAVLGGLFQLYAVGIRNLTCRYISCYAALLISVLTVETYYTEGLLEGSRYGWVIIAIATLVNLLRVGRQWTHKRYS